MAMHDSCAMSPAFAASSPNENGFIAGGTVTKACLWREIDSRGGILLQGEEGE